MPYGSFNPVAKISVSLGFPSLGNPTEYLDVASIEVDSGLIFLADARLPCESPVTGDYRAVPAATSQREDLPTSKKSAASSFDEPQA